MLARTHLVIGAFAMIFFLPHISNKLIFIPVILIASLLPDIDSAFSTLGKSKVLRPLQAFTQHRGMLHSFTFCVLVAIVFAFYLPVLAFAFFLGYSLHLLADSWTVDGIRPFWPSNVTVQGKVRVGGFMEETIFIVFVLLDVVFLVLLFI